MKVILQGKNSKNIEGLLKSLGFEIVTSKPEVIISFGGDGTLLSSERNYPGIPKLPIRNSQFCHKCSDHEDKKLLQNLLAGKLKLKTYQKLQTNLYGKDLLALNDFVVRNEEAIHAIRFKISINDINDFVVRNEEAIHAIRFKISINDIPAGFFIGDGVVIATSFGSTGYFKSIIKESFPADFSGFGLAFNNTTEKTTPIYFDEEDIDMDRAGFQLARGKAILTYDNSPDSFHIAEGTSLEFKIADQVAKIYEPTSLRCPNCQVIRTSN